MNPQSSPDAEAASIPWRKFAVIAAVSLTIAISWWQTDDPAVSETSEPVSQISAKSLSAQQMQALAGRFVADSAALSDDEYRSAALAEEAEMQQQRQQRKKRQQPPSVSNTTPHAHWQHQVEQLHASLGGFREFPEGSIQWHLRNRMKEMLLEEPQR